MPTCPKGHDSATADYCDVCGARIGASAPPAPAPVAGESCPQCGAPRTGRFCEQDGYDFVAASLQPSPPSTPVAGSFSVEVGADLAYFESVRAAGGPDAGGLAFPQFCPSRRFPLRGSQVLIGRRSRSRGVYPDIDLIGPPEDPGVSHSHALLVVRPDRGWAVVDLGSANGTHVNDMKDPIAVNVPVPVVGGDRIYLGAWTILTVCAE